MGENRVLATGEEGDELTAQAGGIERVERKNLMRVPITVGEEVRSRGELACGHGI